MATTTNLGLTLPTVGADDDTWGTINNTVLSGLDSVFAGCAASATLASLIPDYISGLTLSTAGSSATFGVAAGAATNSTNTAVMALASAYTKTTSAWAVGTGNGSLDTSSIANSTWYHVWLIQRSDTKVVDVLISTSASSPTMPTNYDRKRRIGAMKTNGSAQWTKFIQVGDRFDWDTGVQDVAGSTPGGTTASSLTLTVPTGVSVEALLELSLIYTSAAMYAYFTSLDMADVDASGSYFGAVAASQYNTKDASIRTNTSAQIRQRFSSTTGSYGVRTTGWIDARGKN